MTHWKLVEKIGVMVTVCERDKTEVTNLESFISFATSSENLR